MSIEKNVIWFRKIVAEKFDLQLPMPDQVHEIDIRICLDEKKVLMDTFGNRRWDINMEPLGIHIVPLGPPEAALEFMVRCEELHIV